MDRVTLEGSPDRAWEEAEAGTASVAPAFRRHEDPVTRLMRATVPNRHAGGPFQHGLTFAAMEAAIRPSGLVFVVGCTPDEDELDPAGGDPLESAQTFFDALGLSVLATRRAAAVPFSGPRMRAHVLLGIPRRECGRRMPRGLRTLRRRAAEEGVVTAFDPWAMEGSSRPCVADLDDARDWLREAAAAPRPRLGRCAYARLHDLVTGLQRIEREREVRWLDHVTIRAVVRHALAAARLRGTDVADEDDVASAWSHLEATVRRCSTDPEAG